MRGKSALILSLALASIPSFAQKGPNGNNELLQTLKVDVSITVTKHNTGADLVEITAEADDYPAAELQAQSEAIGNALGTPVRGLHIFAASSGAPNGSSFLKATFATNGLLAGEAGIRLQAIARAFAGTQYPSQVQGLLIGLPDVKPLPSTLPSFDSDAVSVQGRTSPNPGIEYRVHLKTQDPSKILIPDRLEAAKAETVPQSGQGGVPIAIVWVLTIVGAAAIGALVYNLALRRPPRTPGR